MKKQKLLILLLFITVCCSAVFMGCNSSRIIIPPEYEDAGYQKVTMYYNGGVEGSNFNVEYFVPKNGRMPIPAPPGSLQQSDLVGPSQTGYELYTWFEIKLDKLKFREEAMYNVYKNDKGETIKEPIYNIKDQHATRLIPYIEGHDFLNPDKNENPLTYKDYEEEQKEGFPEDEKIFIKEWSFDFDKVEKDTCLIAVWRSMRYYVIVPEENVNDKFDDEGYSKLQLRRVDPSGAIMNPADAQLPKKPGFQVEGLYVDWRCTTPVPFSDDGKYYPPVEYVSGTDKFKVIPLYTKWLDAKYKKVSTASDLSRIGSGDSYYITKNIDFAGASISFPEVYTGEIRGNGKVWRNLTVRINQTNQTSGADIYSALFKNLKEAKINGITFENFNVVFVRLDPTQNKMDWTRYIAINLFANEIDDKTEIRDIKMGDPDNPVSYTIVEATAFDLFNSIPVLHNGQPIRQSRYHGWVTVDQNGNYPVEGSMVEIKGKEYRMEYVLDYKGDYDIRRTPLVSKDDGKTLYGYRKLVAPASAMAPVFRENVLRDSEKIVNAVCYMDEQPTPIEFEWAFEYGPDIAPPDPLAPITIYGTVYNFDGWYYEVTEYVETVPYTAFEKYDFTQPATENINLVAMWKRK